MRSGWVRGARATVFGALLGAGLLASASCGKKPAPGVDRTATENLAAADSFLASNAKADGVVTLPSGVQYKVVQSGPAGGESPDSNDLVRVDYEGALTDGTVFDSSYKRGAPAVFPLDAVVPGWTEALQHMHVGDEWFVYLPPKLGYGEDGKPGIPPNSVLVFRLKLLDIARTPGGGKGVGSAMG